MPNYFVSSDQEVQKYLDLLGNEKIIPLDTEGSGLDPYTCKLWSIQLGNRNEDKVLFPYIALNEESRELLRKYLYGKTIIAHNARYDYKMLKTNGFKITSAWDTLNTEKSIYAGKYFTFSLKEVVKRRFGVSLDKEVVSDFYDGTFEALINEKGAWAAWEQKYIDYGLDDIRYLFDIYDSQVEEAKELDMENVVWLENKLVIVNGNQELKGVWLDKAPVKKFAAEMSLKRDTVGLEINSKLENAWRMVWQKEYASRLKIWNTWKIQHDQIKLDSAERDPNDKRKKTTAAKAAVEASNKKKPFIKAPDSENPFNPKSPIKLKAALSELTKFPLETTKHDWLEENMDLHPVIAELIEYRKYEKLAQFTEIVTLINPVTGRLHPEIGLVSTGRESCVPMDTRALTKDGWKNYDELIIGEEILAYDINSKKQKWTKLLNKQKFADVEVGSVGLDSRKFRCTAEHSWVVVKGHNNAVESLVKAREIKDGHRITTNSAYESNSEFCISIGETKKYETDYIKMIVRMSKNQLDSFVLGFLLADGHNTKPTKVGHKYGWQLTQARTVTREQILTAAYLQHSGRIGVGKHYAGSLKHSPSDRVVLCFSPYTSVKKIWSSETIEDVWCPTTEYGTWIMRQGDFITITGNSAKPNLQQIPIRTEEGKQFRSMFKAAKGNRLVGADYAGIELVILAELSNEKVLLDAINEDRDLHCNTISLVLGCPYQLVVNAKDGKLNVEDFEDEALLLSRDKFEKEFSLTELTKEKDLTKWVKKLRDYIKTITYGVVYGLSEFGLMTKFHCSFDEAKRLRDLFFKTYPNMKKFLDEAGYSGLNEGYAKTPLGRRRWFSFPKQKSYAEVEAGVVKALDKQKRIWDSVTEDEWDELIDKAIKEAERELKSRKNTIRRQAANMKIQGCSADITKLAKVLIQQSIPEEQGQIILSIHDELWVECREEYAETAKKILEEDMTRAAKKFLPTAEISVTANICDSWEK